MPTNQQINHANKPIKLPSFWSSLNLGHLFAFQLVATTGSITQAADELTVTPSAISQKITSLERTLGVALLDHRRGRAPRLTPGGVHLLEFCTQLTANLLDLSKRLDSIKRNNRPEIVFMSSPALIYHLQLLLAANFQVNHRIVRIFPSFEAQNVIRAVQSHDVDIGVLPDMQLPHGLQKVPFFVDELILVASPRHRLAQIGHATIGQLTHESFVLPPVGRSIRELTDQWAKSVDLRINVEVETASFEAIKSTITELNLLSVLPRFSIMRELYFGELSAIDVEGFPIERKICLVVRDDERSLALARELLTAAGTALRKMRRMLYPAR